MTKAIPERTKTSHILAPFLSSKYNEHFLQPVYVLIQNGLNVEVELYSSLKALFLMDPRIISTAALIGTNLRAPNVVEHNNSVSIIFFMLRGLPTEIWIRTALLSACIDMETSTLLSIHTPQEFALLKHFGQTFERGGSNVEIVGEVQRKKLAKNFWNVAFSITTLTEYVLSFPTSEPMRLNPFSLAVP